jgi:glycosyltransferase involved in cell wall biosynthesis
VLAPDDPKWVHRDDEADVPEGVRVHRVRYVGPRGRLPAEELHALSGADRALRQAALFSRRLLVPDEFVTWGLTAIPAARRIVEEERIDVLLTTSPPASVNFIGAAVKQAMGLPWVADLRDSIAANPDRDVERLAVRAKEKAQALVAKLVARYADAVSAVSDTIAAEMRDLGAMAVRTIPNGCDFDDFEGLEYRRGDRFRITHTGSFFGKRDPRPFLRALAESDGDVVARFVGGLRSADRDFAEELGLGDRLEELEYVPRRRSLELQRDSEALLLLLPEAGGRGRTVPSGKIFEYLAAERPILAAVPPDGVAADLVRRAGAGVVVPTDDVRALREAITGLEARWRAGALDGTALPPELRESLSRRTRSRELADLVRSVA